MEGMQIQRIQENTHAIAQESEKDARK